MIALLSFAVSPSQSAEIKLVDLGFDGVKSIWIRGTLEKGDANNFEQISENVSHALVLLEGPGGRIEEALAMGAAIRSKGYATYVAPDMHCYSACAVIWVSGARRRMSEKSKIGFHAVYVKGEDGPRETGMGNAELGSFLTHLGLPVEAIRFITLAAPNEMTLLTPARARAVGIDIHLDGGVLARNKDYFQASVHTLAQQTGDLAMMENNCSRFFGVEAGKFKRLAEERISMGHEIIGGAEFGRLLAIAIDPIKDDWRMTNSRLRWCVTAEERLRRQQLNVFSDGPSYNCNKAAIPTEHAICGDQNLSASDRVVAALYRYYKGDYRVSAYIAVYREYKIAL